MTGTILPNTIIGRFRLEERIGHGGMGIVYRAFDPLLNRSAAIKLLAPHLGSDDDALARFHREAALVASFKHTNIATLYEFGEFEKRPYIAMEWIAGRTLKTLMQEEGPLSEKRSLHLFDQLANALDYADSYGVVHRDLKPANIMVGGDDLITIVDFGLAWLDDSQSLTQTGSIVGTPLYMSPEQIQGNPLNGQSDQYSLGIILYEMLCGRPPFDNPTTPALFHQQVFAPAPPITEHNPKVSASVEQALTIALKKDRTERFGNSAEFGRALHMPPPSMPKRVWPIIIGALFAGLLLGLGSIWAFSDKLGMGGNGQSIQLVVPPDDASWIQPAGEPNQRATYYSEANVLDRTARWMTNAESDQGYGIVGAESHIVYAEGTVLVALNWTTGETVWRTNLGAEIIAAPVIYSEWDVPAVIVATADGLIYALSVADAQLIWRSNSDEIGFLQASGLTIDYDGTLYVTTYDGRFLALDGVTGALRKSYEIEQHEEGTFFVSGSAVANIGVFVTTERGKLYAFDHGQSGPQWVIDIHDAPSAAPVIAENLGVVLVATVNGRIKAFSLLSGELQWEQNVFDYITGISAEWNRISVVTQNGTVASFEVDGTPIWEVALGREVTVPLLHLGQFVVVVTRDGKVAYLARADGVEDIERTLYLDQQVEFSPAPIGGWLYVRTAEAVYGFAP